MDRYSESLRPNISVQNPTIEYCLYARKSTEDDERQAMSIDSQIKEMTEMAVRRVIYKGNPSGKTFGKNFRTKTSLQSTSQ